MKYKKSTDIWLVTFISVIAEMVPSVPHFAIYAVSCWALLRDTASLVQQRNLQAHG